VGRIHRRTRPCAPLLLCRFGLASARGLFAPRCGTVALLEAGAAAGVASLFERRRQIIAAAVAADQLFELGCGWRWLRSLSWGLAGGRGGRDGRLGSEGLFLCGYSRFIGHTQACRTRAHHAVFTDQYSSRRSVRCVHLKSPSRAGLQRPSRPRQSLLCRGDMGSGV
jgi:hypothetical protein